MGWTMTVGQAAEASGLTRRAVRLYEERGLLRSAPRTATGYRLYGRDDIDTLTFIRRARALDLSLDDIDAILALRGGGTSPCAAVRTMVDARIAEIDRAIAELRALRATLIYAREEASASGSEPGQGGGVCPVIERHGD